MSEVESYRCAECGQTFNSQRGLTMHIQRSHNDNDALDDEIKQVFRDASAGLTEKLATIEADLLVAGRRVDLLRQKHRTVIAALRRIDPNFHATSKPGPKRKGATSEFRERVERGANDPAKFGRVQRWIEEHDDEFPDGFVGTTIYQRIRAEEPAGVATKDTIGKDVVIAIMRELHSRNVLRVDRIVQGGASLYKLVGRNNDGPSE